MRNARIRADGAGYYHCMSRIIERRMILRTLDRNTAGAQEVRRHAARVLDVIAPDRTYQGQTFSDEVHFVCPWHGYRFDLRTGDSTDGHRLRLDTRPV